EPGPATRPRTVTGAAGTILSGARSGFSLGGIFGSLASAAPLLGLWLGAGIGGTSIPGENLGAAGGAGLGLGILFVVPVLAGGGLAALGPAALAFAGPAALLAAPLLIGGFLLGRSKQRHADEEAAGQFERQAYAAIGEIKDAIVADQIDG